MDAETKQTNALPAPDGGMAVAQFARHYGCDAVTVWKYCHRFPDLVVRIPNVRSGGWLFLIPDPAALIAKMLEPRVRFRADAPAYATPPSLAIAEAAE